MGPSGVALKGGRESLDGETSWISVGSAEHWFSAVSDSDTEGGLVRTGGWGGVYTG